MKYCLVFIVSLFSSFDIYAQEYQGNIDKLINTYIEQQEYVSASNIIVDHAISLERSGALISAYKYELRNIELIDEHFDYFKQNGLTTEVYLENWYVTTSLASQFNNREAIPLYIKMLHKTNMYKKELLPSYTSSLIHVICNCTDSLYRDSIYFTQKSLDVIKTERPSIERLQQYNDICKGFYSNRFYNSVDGAIFKANYLIECEEWFIKNKDYIDKLDRVSYKEDILKYYIDFCEVQELLSSTLSAQLNDPIQAIRILQNCIQYLSSVESLDEQIEAKIASYYSRLANEYYLLRDLATAKEYADIAFLKACNLKPNIDQCTILSSLANVSYGIHNYNDAVRYKKKEIEIRNTIDQYKPQLSDSLVYMLYNSNDTTDTIALGEQLLNSYQNKTKDGLYSLYSLLGSAYSKAMAKAIQSNKLQQYEIYKTKADNCFEISEKLIHSNKDFLKSINMYNTYLAGVYGNISSHYARQNLLSNALEYAIEAYKYDTLYISNITTLSAAMHDSDAIHQFMPIYYQIIKSNILQMMPILGSVEGEQFLQTELGPFQQIYEFVRWNPNDMICLETAYNAILLTKGILLKYSSLAPLIKEDKKMNEQYNDINSFKDNILKEKAPDVKAKMSIDYEIRERMLRQQLEEQVNIEINTSWKDVQNKLSADEVAIEIIEFNYNTQLWCNQDSIKTTYSALLIDKNMTHPKYIELCSQEDLYRLYKLQPKSYTSLLHNDVYRLIWGKLEPYIKNKRRVYFAPSGLLSLIAVENLTDESGELAYKKFNLRRISSTRQINEHHSYFNFSSVSLFGGINYTNNISNLSIINDKLNTRGNWSYLINTQKEIDNIQSTCTKYDISIKSYSNNDATEEAFKNNVSDIIHIASHAFYIPYNKRKAIHYYQAAEVDDYTSNMHYSGLVFANGLDTWNNNYYSVENNDGILSSYEISKLNLSNVKLAVLSACETAVGDLHFDGVIGLQRAFKLAGVNTILMSLWKVDDTATCLFMTSFYNELLISKDVYASFYKAQTITKEKYSDPYYWAGFIILD